jgi:hypothetical protein
MDKVTSKLNALHGLETLLRRRRGSAPRRSRGFVSSIGWTLRGMRFDLRPSNLLRMAHLRRCGVVLGAALGLLGLICAGLWWRLQSGPISLDIATPLITAAIEENFGNSHRVEVGGTVIERDETGRTALRLRDVVVRAPDGGVAASAPRAEVGFSLWSWLRGNRHAQSLRLVGAELGLQIDPSGQLEMVTSSGMQALPTATALSAPKTDLPTLPGNPAAGQTAASTQLPAAKANETLSAFLSWIDSLSALGLDGYDLTEIGLKNGRLVVNDQRNGRKSVFDKISISLTRPAPGEVVLTAESERADAPWSLTASLSPETRGRRGISVDARKIDLGDLLLALRMGNGQIDAQMPISANLKATIAPDGTPEEATGRIMLGAGHFGDVLDPPQGHIHIDRADINIDWDGARRSLVVPFQIVSGANRITLIAQAEAPSDAAGAWPFTISGGSIFLAPASRYDTASLLLNRIRCRGQYDPSRQRVSLDQGEIGSQDVGVAVSGSVDFSGAEPRLAVGLASQNTSVAALKQLWPANVVWPVRDWVLEHLISGNVDRIEIAQNLPVSYLRPNGPPVPDEGLSIDIVTSNAAVQPVDSLPVIRDVTATTRVRGHTASIAVDRGSVEMSAGRKLAISNALIEIPNTQMRNPPVRARMKIDGPVPAAVEFLSLERLRDFSGLPLDPGTSKGNLSAQVTFSLPLDPNLPRGSVNYTIAADITNFAIDGFGNVQQRVEAPALKVSANTQGYSLKGDIKLAGTPASVELRKARDSADSEIKLQATFDDAARSRLGFDLYGAASGPIPIKLSGRIAGAPDQDNRFGIDADLTQVKIDNLLPGWVKAAGRPARAAATYVTAGGGGRLDDIVIDGAGAAIKGALELDGNGNVASVNFPTFALSEGDKANIKAERNSEGALKVVMRGDVFDARNFVKASMGGSARDAQSRGATADLDVDVKLGAVVGFNGEALRGVDLRASRRGGQIKSFVFSGKLGVDAPLIGELRGRAGAKQALYFETNDAGSLFRFTDVYPRMIGGQMWVAMDPPGLEQTPQDGLLNIRNFSIRGEAALNNVVSGAPGGATNGVEFSRLRVEFNRSPGKLTMQNGVVRGPLVGATIDGQIDYAGNDVRLRGTFVPLYGLNNAFGQIPIVGLFLGGPNEGLVGITYEVVGQPGRSMLRVNPASMLTPGLLRKFFEFPNPSAERFPETPAQ